MEGKKIMLLVIGLLFVVALSMICAHSIEEIHYLKSFFPRSFTVTEASLASVVELVKVIIILIPCVFAYKVIKDYL